MALSLQDIKEELRENYFRTEEVLSGMDAYILNLEKRIAVLERQLADIVAARDDGRQAIKPTAPKIFFPGRP